MKTTSSYQTITFLVFTTLLFLTSCSSKPPPKTIVYNKVIYPELPPVKPPESLHIKQCHWQLPLHTKTWTVKAQQNWQGKPCNSYPMDARQNPEFVKACLQHPVDVDSNLIIGLDKKNWLCYQQNMEKLRSTLQHYQQLIDTINQQRADWARKNQLEMFGNKPDGKSG